MNHKKITALLAITLLLVPLLSLLFPQRAAAASTTVQLITGATINSQTDLSWQTSTCSATFDNESETSSDFTAGLGGSVSQVGGGNGLSNQEIQYVDNNIQNTVPIMKFTGGSGCSGIILVPVNGSGSPSVPNTWYASGQFSFSLPARGGSASVNIGPMKFVESSTSTGSITGTLTYYAAGNNKNTPANIDTTGLNSSTASFTINSTPAAVTTPANASTNNPGCYDSNDKLISAGICNLGPGTTTDTNGNTIDPTKNCYVEGTAADGRADNTSWTQVNCNDLSKPVPAGNTAAATPAATATCQSSGFSLAWIACPIVNALADTIDAIYNNIIKPLLVTTPIAFKSSDGTPSLTYNAWTGFRDIADILLIVFLLVIVFGESIGGGLIDAYTAKKVLPRLLVAAVLINLSIYIVAGAVDISNVLGSGIGSLLADPFKIAGGAITLNGGAAGTIDIAGIFGGAAAVGTIWGLVTATGATIGFLLPFISFFALFILLPAVLIFLAILVTVILRQGLILLLIIVSPVAFALYCLPNTEKYFRQWWDWLFKALLIYPLIAIMFAIASDLSITISSIVSQGQNGAMAAVSQLLSVIALIVPLALIPFAFRIAGGLLGKTHELLTNYGKRAHEGILGNANDPTSLRRRTRHETGAKVRDIRKTMYDRGVADTGVGGLRGVRGTARRLVGGRFSSERQALYNKEFYERAANRNEHGDDTYARASTIASSYKSFATSAPERVQRDAAGNITGYQAEDGKFYTEGEIRAGASQNRTRADWEASYRRVLEKSNTAPVEAQRYFASDFADFATTTLPNNERDANAAMVAATLPNKNRHLGTRHQTLKWNTTTQQYDVKLSGEGLRKDFNGSGGYALSGQSQKTHDNLFEAWEQGQEELRTNSKGGVALTPAQRATIQASLNSTEGNLAKFTSQSSVGTPTQPGGIPSFGGSSSASHEDAAMAKATYNRIEAAKEARGLGPMTQAQ
jgi:hypothetical protein